MPAELTVASGAESDVLRVGSSAGPVIDELGELLARYCIRLMTVRASADIPGSFWGEPEAGIAGQDVFVREDTPLHSALHEACHIVCMSAERRAVLKKDAGGTDLEEAAVCYLQITLAGYLPSVGSERLMRDMDRWGYSFGWARPRDGIATMPTMRGGGLRNMTWLTPRARHYGGCDNNVVIGHLVT